MRNFIFFCTSMLLMLLAIGCSVGKEALKFEHLSILDRFDTSISNNKVLRVKSMSFAVQGYISNTKNDLAIDSFANKVKTLDVDTLTQFTITFYKKTKETNTENLAKNPRVLDRYSNPNDLIFIYMWFDGKLGSKYKYKNGKIVAPENTIEISPILD